MNSGKPTKLKTLSSGALVVGLLVWLALAVLLPPGEPVWKGHRLSEWLDAYDTNARFDDSDGPRSGFGDEEIMEAINGIGQAALPCLRYWLTAKPSRLKPTLNHWLDRVGWVRFRFDAEPDLQILAGIGFMAYDVQAQPLLPELLKLSHSPDPGMRMVAYEAAFFTRPEKGIFLPLAHRALNEADKMVQGMAAQWMIERFPAEAEQAGLRRRFPEFFEGGPFAEDVTPNLIP